MSHDPHPFKFDVQSMRIEPGDPNTVITLSTNAFAIVRFCGLVRNDSYLGNWS